MLRDFDEKHKWQLIFWVTTIGFFGQPQIIGCSKITLCISQRKRPLHQKVFIIVDNFYDIDELVWLSCAKRWRANFSKEYFLK
jgi:hypothetical protein